MTEIHSRFTKENALDDITFELNDLLAFMKCRGVPHLQITRSMVTTDGRYEVARWNLLSGEKSHFERQFGVLTRDRKEALQVDIDELSRAFAAVGLERLRFYEPDYENAETVGLVCRSEEQVFVCKNYDRSLFEDQGIDLPLADAFLSSFTRVLHSMNDILSEFP